MIKLRHSIIFAFVIYVSQGYASWAEITLQKLSLEEKIEQMFVVAAASHMTKSSDFEPLSLRSRYKTDPEYIAWLITHLHVGGIIFLHKSTPLEQIALTQKYQSLSNLPLLVVQDCEWGLAMRLDDTIQFPHAMTLGALNNPELIYKAGKEIGRQCAVMGIHLNCAPVADINNNKLNPVIHDRSFGENAQRVSLCTAAFAQGMHDAEILACAKHFPGHGDTSIDSHLALPVIEHSREHLYTNELVPFTNLINKNIDAVMVGHLSVPALDSSEKPATLSYAITTELLQTELGFSGLVITDGMGMEALAAHYTGAQAALQAFLAGNTIILCPLDIPEALQTIKEYIEKNPEYNTLLNAQVLKILQTKEQLNLHKNRFISEENIQEKLHTQEAYALKKQLFSEAITCVHGEKLFPLDTTKSILLLINPPTDTPFATILNIPVVTINNDTDTADILEKFNTYTTVVIGVYGINKKDPHTYGLSETVLSLYEELSLHSRIVTLFGTPYAASLFKDADTLIVAYEQDPDAQEAAANCILGKQIAHGRLPVSLSPHIQLPQQ